MDEGDFAVCAATGPDVLVGEEIVRRAIAGDHNALRRLIERHGPDLRRQFTRQIPHRWQSMISIDDLMQETYTDAFLDIGEFAERGPGSFERWLSTIAKHNLVNAIRGLEAEKRGGDYRRIAMPGSDESYVALHDFLVGTQTSPSGVAARKESRNTLLTALERLPEDHRKVVAMYDLEGLGAAIIATSLNRSPGAVLMLRARAHGMLKRLLGTRSEFLSDGS